MSYALWSAREISQTSNGFWYEFFQRRVGYTLQFPHFCVNFGFFCDRETLSRIYTFAFQVMKALCKINRKIVLYFLFLI